MILLSEPLYARPTTTILARMVLNNSPEGDSGAVEAHTLSSYADASVHVNVCSGFAQAVIEQTSRKEDDGTYIVLMQSVEHPKAPTPVGAWWQWFTPVRAEVCAGGRGSTQGPRLGQGADTDADSLVKQCCFAAGLIDGTHSAEAAARCFCLCQL